jgi:hypothetical protein
MTCNFATFLAMWNIAQGQTTPKIHMKIAKWLEAEKGKKVRPRLLLMAFRSCGKSTLVGVFCAWVLMNNPNTRILILSADLALARKMVRNVKRIIEKHPLTAHLKPDKIDQWGSEKFTVNREMEFRDPSVLAKGITTNLTGTRADIIICDDVEVPKTSDSEEKRYSLRERLLELDYILTPNGSQIYVGTPHCWHTIYADVPRKELQESEEFLRGFSRLVLPIRNRQGNSIWPEKYPDEAIQEILHKTGPAHFKSQMMCEPSKPQNTRLNTALLQIYDEQISVREAQGEKIYTLCGRTLKTVAGFWDPSFGGADNDRSVLAVVYIDEVGEYWLHHLKILQVDKSSNIDPATQQCYLVIKVLEDYNIPIIGLETNGLGKFLPGILERELIASRIRCSVREVIQTKSKSTRILEAFDARLASKSLHIHKDILSTPFVREMEDWHPEKRGGHDDCLDAVAGAIALQPIRINRSPSKLAGSAQWTAKKPTITAKTDFEV